MVMLVSRCRRCAAIVLECPLSEEEFVASRLRPPPLTVQSRQQDRPPMSHHRPRKKGKKGDRQEARIMVMNFTRQAAIL